MTKNGRILNVVDELSLSKMGSLESGGEEELRRSDSNQSKRLKFPKKFSHGYNIVKHATVPRKLRSATKKRNHESISSPFPGNWKLNQGPNGVGRLKKDEKKSKTDLHNTQGIVDTCINKEVLGSITEDEQEVAETLFALAAMLPENSSPSPAAESSFPSINVLEKEKEIRTMSPQFNAEETVKFQSSSDDQLDKPSSMELPIDLNTDYFKVNFPPKAFPFKPEQATERISDNNAVSTTWSELHLPPRIPEQFEPERTPAGREKLETRLNPAAIYGRKTKIENKSKEKQTTATSGSLWPGLNPAGLCSSNMLSPPLEPYDDKYAEWFGNNGFIAQTQPRENFAEKNGQVPIVLKNSWKKSCTHVYVSRLIKVLETSEKADKLLLQSAQSTQTNGSNQGVHVTNGNLICMKNDSHRVFSGDNADCLMVEKTTDEIRNAILLHKKLLQDQRQAFSKQNPDFMSFQAQGKINGGSSSFTKAGQTVEASKQLRVHHLTSENQPLSFLLPQNCYSSSFGHHSSTAASQQVILPPYVGNAVCAPSIAADPTVPPRLQLHRGEIVNWPTQFTAPYKHAEVSVPEWQNGGQNSHFLSQSAQTMFPSPRSSLDIFALKQAPISLEPQRLMPISSSPSASRVRGQYYQLPDGFEGNRHKPALQMLCNSHH